MHPALPGLAGTPASQTQHCYTVRRAAAAQSLLFSITNPSVVRASIHSYLHQAPPAACCQGTGLAHQTCHLTKSTHLEKEKGIHSAGELGRDTHRYCTCNLGMGRTQGFLSHSNVSSYRRAINKPGGRAGGGALHTSSAGQGPGSHCSRGDPPRAKEAPGSCQSCSRRPHGTGKHSSILGLLQFTRL